MLDFSEIKARWFQSIGPFPDIARDAAEGVDLMHLLSLDSSVAGCIDTFVHSRGQLDDDRIRYLRRGCHELKRAVRNLQGPSKLYFQERLALTRAVLENTTGKGC